MSADNNIKVIRKEDEEFPWFLANMPSSPKQLFYIGNIELLRKPCVAVVGARKCSEYGRQVAVKIGKVLAENRVVTVSGMADGIDSFAHWGAIKNSGDTIAVLGCGVDICYPRVNRKLYDEICRKGLVISEFEPGTPAKKHNFPMRNRIIAAISEVVTVVEAQSKSGSLITAGFAAEQGKELMAVPGNISSSTSVGCNRLIADGAGIVTRPEDIIRAMGREPRLSGDDIFELGEDERKIYDLLSKKGELSLDEICAYLSIDPTYVSGIITVMEIKGLISYSLGKIFIEKF